MAAIEPSGKSLASTFASLYLDVMADVLGKNGADAVLRRAGLEAWAHAPPDPATAPVVDHAEISALFAALEETLGARGASGLQRRMGAGAFDDIIRPLGPIAAIQDPAFQALPAERRLRAGMHALSKVLPQFGDWGAEAQDSEDGVLLRVATCPHCWNHHADGPSCPATVSLTAAAARWSVPELEIGAAETACRANGSPACEVSVRLAPQA